MFVFLGICVIAVIGCCITHLVSEWRKVKYVKPRHGPTAPPYYSADQIDLTDMKTRVKKVKAKAQRPTNGGHVNKACDDYEPPTARSSIGMYFLNNIFIYIVSPKVDLNKVIIKLIQSCLLLEYQVMQTTTKTRRLE